MIRTIYCIDYNIYDYVEGLIIPDKKRINESVKSKNYFAGFYLWLDINNKRKSCTMIVYDTNKQLIDSDWYVKKLIKIDKKNLIRNKIINILS